MSDVWLADSVYDGTAEGCKEKCLDGNSKYINLFYTTRGGKKSYRFCKGYSFKQDEHSSTKYMSCSLEFGDIFKVQGAENGVVSGMRDCPKAEGNF